MKTYKQLVNNILIRLREREVSSIDESSYSKLIGLFVHDAIELVESAWGWSNNRVTITVNTVDGTSRYALANTGDKSTVLEINNSTGKQPMSYKDTAWFTNVFLNNTPATGVPRYYNFDTLDSSGDMQIDVYPVPDGVYSIAFKVIKRAPNILNDDDEITIPFLPVQALAYAMAVEERGEDGGMSAISAKALAQAHLGDAIAIDANKHPEDLIWEAP